MYGSKPPMTPPGPSHSLLEAALCGLLCLTPACQPTASATTPTVSGDTPIPDVTCDGGFSAMPKVTSASIVPNLTLDAFTTMCDTRHGFVEIQPHCGGSNACRGMSYDTETKTLTEHTCRGMNACSGYSCIICS